ncbi:MAG: gamma-butyrobetaine hydroxylase-like domain-containing protein [Phycisphaerae bacterium]
MTDNPSTNSDGHWTGGSAIVPIDIKLQRARDQLVVTWPDGQTVTYSAATLRRNCPCATCRGERKDQSENPLHIMANAPGNDPTMVGAELMGHYAIKIIWSDGHDTGIFDYRYLHSLDPG